MKKLKPAQSKLWAHINQTKITKDRIQNLADFKSSDLNFKISIWDPRTNGVRYMKALLYNLASFVPSKTWKKISKTRNRNFGSPITIRYNGEDICLDYLQAIFEMEFIEKHVQLNNLNILEIGAGYGRTCHAIMSNYKIKNYCIIDLKNCLELSKRYLRKVLRYSDFKKISFNIAEDIDLLKGFKLDLCINVDSFAEMRPEAVKYYLNYIDKHCSYFYVKNPVGKYFDKSLDGHFEGKETVGLALNTGLLRDIIDIHDNDKVKAGVAKFIKSYQPGEKWKCIEDSWARPWSYYWHALYRKSKIGRD